ncbi:MAG TPA: hypothetical protein VFU29_19215 [Chitinophagaceae bacterium]|nr:hypothetical protein [Chitinophagaceae bacterium]
MEVHAHTHTPRKKWSHYFWEFLMLFLAVFCGFLAEYQLEHKIEKDKEKQYVHSLLEDLHEDTASLTATVNEFDGHLKRNDTLIRLLTTEDIKYHASDLYYLARRASRSVRPALHDFTIQQMKSSGGFRLIRNQIVSKAIIEYYNRTVFIDYLNGIESNESDEYRKMATEIFHPVTFNEIVNSDNTIARPADNPPLLTYDPKILLRLAGMVSYIRNTKMGLMKAETEMRAAAIDLIKLIKQEYHLN